VPHACQQETSHGILVSDHSNKLAFIHTDKNKPINV
jgi:hypothetical protein